MPGDLTPALLGAALTQILFLLAGVVVLWRVRFAPDRRIPAPARLRPWTISGFDFALACAVVMGAGVAGQVTTAALLRRFMAPLDPDLQLVIAGGSLQVGLLLGALVAARIAVERAPLPPPREGPTGRRLLLAGAATFAAAMPLLLAVNLTWNFLLEGLGFPTARQDLVEMFARADSAVLVLVVASLAVVVAPVAEELLFRAGLFRYLRTRVPRPFALGVPAVVFALLHGNLAAFAPLVVLGIIFALAYERTGRIAVPIIAHGLFNLNTLLLLLTGVV